MCVCVCAAHRSRSKRTKKHLCCDAHSLTHLSGHSLSLSLSTVLRPNVPGPQLIPAYSTPVVFLSFCLSLSSHSCHLPNVTRSIPRCSLSLTQVPKSSLPIYAVDMSHSYVSSFTPLSLSFDPTLYNSFATQKCQDGIIQDQDFNLFSMYGLFTNKCTLFIITVFCK